MHKVRVGKSVHFTAKPANDNTSGAPLLPERQSLDKMARARAQNSRMSGPIPRSSTPAYEPLVEEHGFVSVLRDPTNGGFQAFFVIRQVALPEGPKRLLVRGQVHDLGLVRILGQRFQRRDDLIDGRQVIADQVHFREYDPAVEVLPRIVLGEILGASVVQIVVDVPDPVALMEIPAEHFHAALGQRLEDGWRQHGPVRDRGGRVGSLAGKTMYLLDDLIEIGDHRLRRCAFVGPRRKVRVGMERELQPITVFLPFLLVAAGELRQVETLVVCEIDVQGELGTVRVVQSAEHAQIEALKNRLVALLGNIAEEEHVVVDGESVSGFGVLVPDDAHSMFAASLAAFANRHDVRLVFAQKYFGGKSSPGSLGWLPAHRHAIAQRGTPGHLDRQPICCRATVTMVQHGAVKRLFDLEQPGICRPRGPRLSKHDPYCAGDGPFQEVTTWNRCGLHYSIPFHLLNR